jgi:hypothetical protein
MSSRILAILLFASVSLCLTASDFPKNRSPLKISVQRVPNGGLQPQLVTTDGHTLHLLYYAGDPAHGDLYYVHTSDAGHTWSAPLRVNTTPGAALALGTIRGGQLAVGRNGRAYVAWNGSSQAKPQGLLNPESGKTGAPMLYSRLNDTHTAFEPERNLLTATFGLDGGGTIAADSTGHVFVAWHAKAAGAKAGEAGRQVWIATSADDGKTFLPEHPAANDPTGACGCCGMALFTDSHGVVRALYRSATQNVHRDIYLLTSPDQARSFTAQKLDTWNINACPMSSMAFAENAGKVEGAWETGGQVYFKNLADESPKPISATGPGTSHKHPRLAIASNGETLLLWTQGTGWNRGGTAAWQVYDSTGKPIGEKGTVSALPAWSFAATAATPEGFLILY